MSITMDPIGLLIWIVVAILIVALIIYLVRLIPLPNPWGRIVEVAIIILAILVLLRKLLLV